MKNNKDLKLTIGLLLLDKYGMKVSGPGNLNFNAEKEEIKQVIQKQTNLVYQRNFRKHLAVLAHAPYVVKVGHSERFNGWEKYEDLLRYNKWRNINKGMEKYRAGVQSDFDYKIFDHLALVTYKESMEGENSMDYHVCLLEKMDGHWKVIYHDIVSLEDISFFISDMV